MRLTTHLEKLRGQSCQEPLLARIHHTLPYFLLLLVQKQPASGRPLQAYLCSGTTYSLSPAGNWAPLPGPESFQLLLKLCLVFYSPNLQRRVPHFKNSVFFSAVLLDPVIWLTGTELRVLVISYKPVLRRKGFLWKKLPLVGKLKPVFKRSN